MCFLLIMCYCCIVFKRKDMSVPERGARRQHICFKCHSMHENMVMGRESSNHVVTKTVLT